MNLNNNYIEKKFIKANIKFNIKNKKYSKELEIIEEQKLNFLDNFDKIKHRLKQEDIKNINNWDSYKKKLIFKQKKKKVIKKPISINSKWYLSMMENLKLMSNENTNFDGFTKNINFRSLLKKFLNIDLKKINNIKFKRYFNKPKTIYINVDLRRLKTVITVNNFKKQILTITNGLMFKKMNLNNKKYKKSNKLTFLIMKNTLLKLNFLKNFNLAYIYIKGVSQSSNGLIDYLNKNIKKNNTNTNVVIINSYKISNNKQFKFKKIKAIKRRLKKKFIKLN